MERKLKICCNCKLQKVIWKRTGRDGWCRDCWSCHSGKPEPKARKRPRSVSGKRENLNKVYSVIREKFLLDHPMCHARIDARCKLKSSEIHHKKGRVGEYFLDTRFWLPSCSPCHKWITEHPAEAEAIGLSLSRLTDGTEKNNGSLASPVEMERGTGLSEISSPGQES